MTRSLGADPMLADVVAFTSLPGLWVGQSLDRVALSLAQSLERTVHARAVAVLLVTEAGTVERRAGESVLLDDAVERWRRNEPIEDALRCDVGPMGARGAILLHPASYAPEKLHLARLAANLADTALREAALDHQVAATRETIQRLEKASMLGQLVSGVAHELRTPLTYAGNNLYLLQGHLARLDIPPASRERIQEILAEVASAHERIERTVGTLRRLNGARRAVRDEVLLKDVVAEAARLFSLTSVGAVDVRAELDGEDATLADPIEVQQVALNLLQNARDASPPGGRIRLRTWTDADGAHLLVEDEGPGIPPDVRARMFEPFFSTKPQGTGIGLSVVRRIAETHGASIRVSDRAPRGARVEVVFPLARVPAAAPPAAAPSA
ncbi:MAG: hypothetical protein QOE90_1395 [Thermoplasmata archaeon]|nr:hypothetical protein [Thermoplasmata archaeon]